MRVRRKYIRSLVENLLSDSSVTSAPVPVRKLAKEQGIQVCQTSADDEDLSGFMYRDETGAAVIGVNSDHSENRKRFTIGHELGHFMLHDQDGVHVDRGFQIKLRNKVSSEGTDIEEQEANFFSAELLMPVRLLDDDLEEITEVDLENETTVAKLAKKYRVSTQAMTFRLAYLGYLNL